MFCPHCGGEVSDDTKFCKTCGKAIKSTTTQLQKEALPVSSADGYRPDGNKKRSNTAIIVGIVCCLIILAAGGIGIGVMMTKNSPKAAVAELKKNIENGDYVYLKDHLLFTTNDTIDKDIAKSFVHYLNDDRSNLQGFIAEISLNDYSNVIGEGSLFNKEYIYYIEPSYIEAKANAANTEIYLDGELKTTIDAASGSTNIGPLLPMQYQVTAKNKTWKAEVSQEVNFMESGKSKIPVELIGTKKAPAKTPAPSATPAPTQAPSTKTIIIREPNVSVPVFYANYDYILPNSDTTLYSSSYLDSLDKETLRYARNEIYARYGRTFNDDVLQGYFNSKSWYYPDSWYLDTKNDPELNSVEKKNVDRIKAAEAKK